MPSTRYSRRRLLALCGTVGVATLAGCANRLAGGSTNDTATSVNFRLFRRTETLRDRYVIDPEETRVPWDEDALAAAVNGTDYTTQYAEPFPTNDPAWAEYDGTYYRLDAVVVGEETVTRPVLRLTEEKRLGEGGSGAPESADADDLPETDRRAVHVAYMAARARGNAGGVPWGLVQRGGYVYRDDDAAETSELLAEDGPAYVTYRDRIWEVELARETFHEAVYRPDADAVAETPAEMEAVLRGKLVGARIDPASLPEGQRAVFEEARSDAGYSADHPFPDAFVAVLKRLDERAYADGNVSKDAGVNDYPPRRVIRYGEAYYEYRLELTESDAE